MYHRIKAEMGSMHVNIPAIWLTATVINSESQRSWESGPNSPVLISWGVLRSENRHVAITWPVSVSGLLVTLSSSDIGRFYAPTRFRHGVFEFISHESLSHNRGNPHGR